MNYANKKAGDLLHTPEGVRDCYGKENTAKQATISKIAHVIRLYGYEDLQTPAFEYFDVFSNEIGTTPSKDLFKFFDKEGNTLVLRPDFTPSVARCAAKYFMDEKRPLRFCYQGSAFCNTNDLQGKLKETTQMGAELMNDAGAQADGEMIAMLIESLLAAGLHDFQISAGNVEYFKAVCEHLSMDASVEMALPSERAREAIRRLIDVYHVVDAYGLNGYLSFDLSLLSKYHHYTGIIFKGYTYGTGEPIASGGRYDQLLSYFGKTAPAIGCMISIDPLMEALRRQRLIDVTEPEIHEIYYNKDNYLEALKAAKMSRTAGYRTVLLPENG